MFNEKNTYDHSRQQESKQNQELLPTEQIKPAPFYSLYSYLSSFDFLLLSLAIITLLTFSIAPIFLVIEIGQLIDVMTDIGASQQDFYDQQKQIALVMILLGIGTLLFSWISVALFIKIGTQVGLQWKARYFQALMSHPISWFDLNNAAQLGSLLDQDCDKIQKAAGQKVLLIVQAVLLFSIAWAYSFWLNTQLFIVGLAMLPFQLGAALTIETASFKASAESSRKYQVAGGIAQESLEGIKTVVSCNAQEKIARTYQQELEPLRKSTVQMGAIHGFGWSVFFFVMFAFSGILFYYGTALMNDEEETWLFVKDVEISDIVQIFFATAVSALHLGICIPCLDNIKAGCFIAGKIMHIIEKSEKLDGNYRPNELKGNIRLEKVYFSYPSSSGVPILQELSFELEAGKTKAIVGQTGCGKSTIIQLILGFYYPNFGSIYIDDVQITKYDLKSLRNYIGLVSQEPLLFNADIKENIRIGRLDASEKQILAVLEEAEAGFIYKKGFGLDTYVGNKGSQLSGGQKQRIAIARALIKKPKILLLDQATSALDLKTQNKIQATLNRVMQDKTTIIVAQRLSTIKHADQIIVLVEGKAVEEGTHQELINNQGYYYNLLNIQEKKQEQTEKLLKQTKQAENEYKKQLETVQEEEQNKQGNNFKRIFQMTKAHWPFILLAGVCAVSSGTLFPIFGYYFADDLITTLQGIDDSALETVQENMIILIIEAIINLFTTTLLCFSLAWVTAQFTYKLRYQGMKSLLFYDQKFYDQPNNNPASLSSRFGSDTEKISNIGGTLIGIWFLIFSSLIGGVIIAMIQDPVFALVILGMVPFLIVSNAKGQILQIEGIANKDLKDTSAVASDSFTNIKTVHAFNRQEYFQQEYIKASVNQNSNVMKKANQNGFLFGTRYFVLYALWALMSWYGAWRVNHDQMDLDEMLIAFFAIVMASWGFLMVGALVPDVQGGLQAADGIFDMIDYTPQIDAQNQQGKKDPIQGKISFVNVKFMYEGRNAKVLDGITFQIQPGKTLGITGTSGSGKSTIAQLILRFYDPISGIIQVDGIDIKEFNLNYIRQNIAWVGQQPILFKGSLLYNMQIAKDRVTQQEAVTAISLAQGQNIIEKYGLDNDVGLRGSKLSGGQKQRIAIARALVKALKVLILDEATSALDNNTQKELLQELKNMGLTLISIAHRLNTIKDSDKILMLEKGIVIEEGTHDELMELPTGAYKSLYNQSN